MSDECTGPEISRRGFLVASSGTVIAAAAAGALEAREAAPAIAVDPGVPHSPRSQPILVPVSLR